MAAKAGPAKPAVDKAFDDGPVTRAVQDMASAAEALTVGAVHLTRNTITAAVETVEDVGGRIGSLAVDAAEGTVLAVNRIGSVAGRSLLDALAGTVAGVKTVLAEAGVGSAAARRPLALAPEATRRPLARAKRRKRASPAPKRARTA